MNWRTILFEGLAFVKRLAIPLLVAGFLILVPPVRYWLTAQVQAHSLLSAVGLGAACFAIAFLLTGNRGTSQGTQSPQFRDAGMILFIVLILLGAGFFLTSASPTFATEKLRISALRTSVLWASAWFMAGFLAGFLFGVPKVVGDGPPTPPTGGPPTGSTPRGFAQRPNTNLEQISDWLTKIIVGLGLVELRSVPAHLKSAATWVAQTLALDQPPSKAAVSFAGSLIVYFIIIGFLAGYLLTLLFLAGAFGRAGEQAYGGGGAFGEDNLSDRIRNFWRPNNGAPDQVATPKLLDWITKNLPPGTSITDLISTNNLNAARKKVVADLSIQ